MAEIEALYRPTSCSSIGRTALGPVAD